MDERIRMLEHRLRQLDFHTSRHFDQLHAHMDGIAKHASEPSNVDRRLHSLHDRMNSQSRRLHEQVKTTTTIRQHVESLDHTVKGLHTMMNRKRPTPQHDVDMILHLVFKLMDRDTAARQTCIICQERHRNCALIPCGHHMFCKVCVGRLKERRAPRCPLCRVPIQNDLCLTG